MLDIDNDRHAHPATPSEIRQFLSRALDAYALEEVKLEQVREALAAAWEGAAIFNLSQIALSRNETADTRALAMEELDQALRDVGATALAERRLFSALLPDGCTVPPGPEAATFFLQRLFSLQLAIDATVRSFTRLDDALFADGKEDWREQFLATAVREGLLRQLVLCVADEEVPENIYFSVLKQPSVRSFPRHRQVIGAWIAELPVETKKTTARQFDFEDEEGPADDAQRIQKRKRFDRDAELRRVLERAKSRSRGSFVRGAWSGRRRTRPLWCESKLKGVARSLPVKH